MKPAMPLSEELRLYVFTNFYLSSIQHGIQAAHVCTELTSKYRMKKSRAALMLKSWEERDKTIIMLNGGMEKDLRESYNRIEHLDNSRGMQYPFVCFFEEAGALHKLPAMTAWGIVLPRTVYLAKYQPPSHDLCYSMNEHSTIAEATWYCDTVEYEICKILDGKGLAR
jgi:hypothetical protein